MSNSPASSNEGDKHPANSKEAAVAKTAGFVVFSGIAMSILKTLNPFKKERDATSPSQQPAVESIQSSPIPDSPPPLFPEPTITKKAGGLYGAKTARILGTSDRYCEMRYSLGSVQKIWGSNRCNQRG
ncbi:Jojoba acyl CoA reductase-related male sterility protein [Hibiscus syriacus]|uniref:Jojoba acyl CoA reductase-related male sterility protein n=1 Tax=Hibiscus syriacus TaxID=106335 RepID=A0A6A2WNY3_HIBSY|nr:uncharacterized protein LOC120187874 [Hibiscus syriacus]KAE8661371.1 Jojoba acyl CoA reductase-related male sterility protein [Hibiscus syriacus]